MLFSVLIFLIITYLFLLLFYALTYPSSFVSWSIYGRNLLICNSRQNSLRMQMVLLFSVNHSKEFRDIPTGSGLSNTWAFCNESRIIWITCLITCKQKCYKRKDNDRIFDIGQSRQNENELNSKSYHFFQDLRMISMNSQEGRLQWNWEKNFCFYKIVQYETVQNLKDSPHYYSLEVWFINQWKQHKDSFWF